MKMYWFALNLYDFLSYVEDKRSYFYECWTTITFIVWKKTFSIFQMILSIKSHISPDN